MVKSFFSTCELIHFSVSQMQRVGTLWAQLLLQLYSELFETLQMFCSMSEYVHLVLDIIIKLVFPFLTSYFSASHTNGCLLCQRNSSDSCILSF